MESRLDPSARFKGTLVTRDDLLIEGILEGSVQSSAKVVVAPEGRVVGPIRAREVEIAGTVEGNVVAEGRLRLAASGKVRGDVKAAHLTVEDGGVLHGKVLAEVSEEAPGRA